LPATPVARSPAASRTSSAETAVSILSGVPLTETDFTAPMVRMLTGRSPNAMLVVNRYWPDSPVCVSITGVMTFQSPKKLFGFAGQEGIVEL
jgi:hypothetical protein